MAVDINFSLMEWQKKVQKISCIKYFDSNVSIEKKNIYIYPPITRLNSFFWNYFMTNPQFSHGIEKRVD